MSHSNGVARNQFVERGVGAWQTQGAPSSFGLAGIAAQDAADIDSQATQCFDVDRADESGARHGYGDACEAGVHGSPRGTPVTGTLPPGGTEFRAFEGTAGQTVFVSVRSSAFEPAVSLRGPDGVLLAADNRGTAATGSLTAIKLPKSGRYTVWISSRRGAGEFAVRLIDGD